MKIIFTNDDTSLTSGFTDAITNCFIKGMTTSTSLRINGTDFVRTVKILKSSPIKKIGLGLHLNLTDGPTENESLSNTSGHYKYSFPIYLFFSLTKNKQLEQNITNEFEAQYQKATTLGLTFDHVDSQDHVHMIPFIFELVCKLCVKHKIRSIRVTNEPSFMGNTKPALISIAKALLLQVLSKIDRKILEKYKLKSTDAFYGVRYTNQMNTKNAIAAINDARKRNFNIIEIASHPAYACNKDLVYTSNFIKKYANLPNRTIEAKTLMSNDLRKYMTENKIERTTFKNEF